MPGRTPNEAYRAFVEPLARALACVATAKIQPSVGGTHVFHRDHNLYLTRQGDSDYVRLRGEPALDFRARMVYRLIEDPRAGFGPIRVTTRAYDYSLRLATGESVVDYHWHPDGVSHEARPHLHLGSAQLQPHGVIGRKHHLPTGRVTFESVIRTAVELGATPLHEDWQQRLEDTETPHIRYRSWSVDPSNEIGS
jgi:hypothetical protein